MRINLFAASAVTVLALASAGAFAQSNNSQNYTGQIMDSACAQSGSHQAMEQKAGIGNNPAECTRKCVQQGASYVLFVPSSKTVYKLSNQSDAARLAGQDVTVNGSIQPGTNELLVVTIAPAR